MTSQCYGSLFFNLFRHVQIKQSFLLNNNRFAVHLGDLCLKILAKLRKRSK